MTVMDKLITIAVYLVVVGCFNSVSLAAVHFMKKENDGKETGYMFVVWMVSLATGCLFAAMASDYVVSHLTK